MNNVLKQRLVGALILVALGVVFWPIIFVEPDTGPSAPVVRMPPPPVIDTAPLPSPDKVGLRSSPPLDVSEDELESAATDPDFGLSPASPAASAVDANQPTADGTSETVAVEPAAPVAEPEPEPETVRQPRDQRPAQPETDDQGIPVAWTLQVVSVSSKDSAEQTRQRLDAMGHKAYVKVAEVSGRKLYRVYVGPKFERARLDDIQADIDRQLGVKSMVRRYYP
ncbi:SPOR domain-containing protein [Parahaliea aestuarii]|uniref:SPOR domain-containing protein n=1 Tax=Parahaliea aestuarii TaxID=1852021 RepID=A0A5C8ZTC4_9GAMM|nr:SPOR domain-containing protein [Parahaliea aestuarii]TXS91044.1 hypothetical protein FVW59_12610 [Parahaliea aestuarii]